MPITVSSEMSLVGNPPGLQRGSSGAWVTQLQQVLAAKGYNVGNIDGKYGPITEAAVIAFQRESGLVADGIVGQKTWTKLLDKGTFEKWTDAIVRVIESLNIKWPWEKKEEIPETTSLFATTAAQTSPIVKIGLIAGVGYLLTRGGKTGTKSK